MRFLLCLLWPLFVFGIDQRQTPLTLTTSVVLPCPFELIESLPLKLKNYNNQVNPPTQVVICLEQSSKVDTLFLQQLLQKDYFFDLRVVSLSSKTAREEMKNQACRETTGNILIIDSMEDPVQSSKVETIKTCFECYEIDFLAPVNYEELVEKGPFFDLNSDASLGIFTTGSYAFTRALFQKIQWEEHANGEELFIQKIQSSYKDRMFGLILR